MHTVCHTVLDCGFAEGATPAETAHAVNFAAQHLYNDPERYKRHPIPAVRDRIDQIRAQRGLKPFRDPAEPATTITRPAPPALPALPARTPNGYVVDLTPQDPK